MDKFWVVTNPKRTSTLADCIFETDTRGLVLQVRGGLSWDEHEPQIHADRASALRDLDRRLKRLSDDADMMRMEIDALLNPPAEVSRG